MELEMADLNFFTLKYKQAERERKVGAGGLRVAGSQRPWGVLGMWVQLFLTVVVLGVLGALSPGSWRLMVYFCVF